MKPSHPNPDVQDRELERMAAGGDVGAAKELIRRLARSRQPEKIFDLMLLLSHEEQKWAASQYWSARGIHDPHWWYVVPPSWSGAEGFAVFATTQEEAMQEAVERGAHRASAAMWMDPASLKHFKPENVIRSNPPSALARVRKAVGRDRDCYPAAEVVYHSGGGKRAGLTPVQQRHQGRSHWWVRGQGGEVLDPAAAQFSRPVPYRRGRGKGFLTKKPSKRARALARRAGVKLNPTKPCHRPDSRLRKVLAAPGELFHVRLLPAGKRSRKRLTLRPGIPRNEFPGEDMTIERVSLAGTPGQALAALYAWELVRDGLTIHFYTNAAPVEARVPPSTLVPDVRETGEVWCRCPVPMVRIAVMGQADTEDMLLDTYHAWREMNEEGMKAVEAVPLLANYMDWDAVNSLNEYLGFPDFGWSWPVEEAAKRLVRCNPDESDRHAEREAAAGDVEAAARVIVNRVRRGEIPMANVRLAGIWTGRRDALLADPPPHDYQPGQYLSANRRDLVRWALRLDADLPGYVSRLNRYHDLNDLIFAWLQGGKKLPPAWPGGGFSVFTNAFRLARARSDRRLHELVKSTIKAYRVTVYQSFMDEMSGYPHAERQSPAWKLMGRDGRKIVRVSTSHGSQTINYNGVALSRAAERQATGLLGRFLLHEA